MADRPPKAPPQPGFEGYHMPAPRPQPQPAQPPRAPGQPLPPMTLQNPNAAPVGGPPRKSGKKGPPRARRPEDSGPPERSAAKSLAIYLGFAFVSLFVFAAAYIIGSSPQTLVQERLIEAVKAQTGRDLAIKGGTSFTFFPRIGVVMRDVSLSAPPGMEGQPTARIGELDVLVRAAPLLQREVELERLVVRNATFDLRVDKTGRRSWQFTAVDDPARAVRYAQARTGKASDAGGALPQEAREFLKNATDKPEPSSALGRLRNIALDDVRVENGTLTYSDERSGQSETISAINASLAARALDAPLETKGSLVVSGEKVEFDGRLTSVKLMLGEQPAKLTFNASAAPVKTWFDGSVQARDLVDLNGAFTLAAPSARALAGWAGTTLPPSEGFGPLAIKGNLHAAGKALSFTDATIELDGAVANGSLSAEAGAARPSLKANLKISELDLNKYASDGQAAAPPARTPAKAPAADATSAPASPPAAPASPKSIEDLLGNAPTGGARVKGYVKRAGWSDQPISTASLGLADVDATLMITKTLVRDIKLGQSRLKVALKDKLLRANVEDVALYDGHAHGVLTVDASSGAPKISASLVSDGLTSQQLLKDAADIDWLSGTGRMQLALAGQGASEKQIVDTLDGSASFGFANGAIGGFNVAQILRGLSQGKLGGLQRVPTEKTDFSELTASFTIKDGVADNQDLKLASPLLNVSGAGRIMLGARQIDYTAKPKVVGTLPGQSGPFNLTGLEVPIRIQGSWDAPNYTPELQGVLKSAPVQEIIKDPGKAVDTVKEIGKKLGGKKAGDLLKGLFGGN